MSKLQNIFSLIESSELDDNSLVEIPIAVTKLTSLQELLSIILHVLRFVSEATTNKNLRLLLPRSNKAQDSRVSLDTPKTIKF
ncbi:hypothetical protein V9T40_006222 [Parthenolecanium corni]|uniref:Uncharacterized protein n=1 Tax=Parthenolecanium corni TaxID=536013 RepID=A0AAN9TVG0_9HEMI